MANLNRVTLIGRLTRNPEIRFTAKGVQVGELSLAVTRTWKDEAGQRQEETTFIDCTLFGRQAEIVGQYLAKGSPIFLEGRLHLDSWEDKQTGQKRSRLKVVGEHLQFLGQREAEAIPSAAAPVPPRPTVPARGERSQPAPASRASLVDPELDVDPF
jgi:single-strand DNA-binding protein